MFGRNCLDFVFDCGSQSKSPTYGVFRFSSFGEWTNCQDRTHLWVDSLYLRPLEKIKLRSTTLF